jgi:hypothetical protein
MVDLQSTSVMELAYLGTTTDFKPTVSLKRNQGAWNVSTLSSVYPAKTVVVYLQPLTCFWIFKQVLKADWSKHRIDISSFEADFSVVTSNPFPLLSSVTTQHDSSLGGITVNTQQNISHPHHCFCVVTLKTRIMTMTL